MITKRNAVGWFEIYVDDLVRASAFYEKTLGVKLSRLPSPSVEMMAFPGDPEQPGCTGALVKMEGKGGGGSGTIIYFSCQDCSEEAGRAAANGGRVHKAKQSIGEYGFIALVFDTEENMIGLHSLK
jgi:predicted enzyme related to lactoylglutathione lyase